MPSRIQQRIRAFCRQRPLRAPSLIVSAFGDAVLPRGGRVWLGSLIQLLQPLGVSERLVRTSVFRLAKDQWLSTEPCGRRADYRLTASGLERINKAARRIYASWPPDWDRRWQLILVVGGLDAVERQSLRRALFWEGFGFLGPDCFVHPTRDLSSVFDVLAAEGGRKLAGKLLPLVAAEPSLDGAGSSSELVARAWNLEDLARGYEEFVQVYTPVLAEWRKGSVEPSNEETFHLRLLLIHDYRRLLLRDPELPDVLLPRGWPGQRARVLCKELYRRLATPSERHLDAVFRTADGACPAVNGAFYRRFQDDDPLSS